MLRFPDPLIPARFLSRPNRFVILAEVAGQTARVRCPSPGSLRELLTPGVELRVHLPPGTAPRATDYTLALIRHGRRWVSIDTQLPNRLFRTHLEHRRIPVFADTTAVQREVK